MLKGIPSHADILDASRRIREHIHETPVLSSAAIDKVCGTEIYFKCENFQKAGAFKSRGAVNAVFSLDPVPEEGVCTHSSGNHAQALARAAAIRRIPAHIVMPSNAPKVKVEAVKAYGGRITFCEPNLSARESTLEKVKKETGALEIHPYNNYTVIAGQATCALELIEQVPGLQLIMPPVGGGGLLSGTALTAAYSRAGIEVYAAEPCGADDAFRSLKAGRIIPSTNPNTIADGLLTSLGTLTFPIIMEHVTGILTVSEQAIIEAMRLIWGRLKIVVEPSAAVTLAAVLEYQEKFRNRKTGLILSGGNIDLDKIPWIE